jgi:hypothetical protein
VKLAFGEVVDVFVNENEELIKTGAAFATLSQSAVTASRSAAYKRMCSFCDFVAKCSYGEAIVQLQLR